MTLSILRKQIDQINQELVVLLSKRLEIAKQIAQLKKENRLPILDSERESAIKEKIRSLAKKHQLSSSMLEEIFQIVLDYTRIEMGAI